MLEEAREEGEWRMGKYLDEGSGAAFRRVKEIAIAFIVAIPVFPNNLHVPTANY